MTDYIDLRTEIEIKIEQLQMDCKRSFEDILEWLINSSRPEHVHEVEDGLWLRLLALGCQLITLWTVCRLPSGAIRILHRKGGRYLYQGLCNEPIKTRFGVVQQLRRVYLLVSGNGPKQLSPDDRLIGLSSGRMSLRVQFLTAFLAARLSFDESLVFLRQFSGYTPSKRSSLGIIDQLGPSARAFVDQLPAPEDDGEILVIQIDCKGTPMIHPDEHAKRCRPHKKRPKGSSRRNARRLKQKQDKKPRRKKGEKSKNARMSPVAVVYTLSRLPDGSLEGPINKRILSVFGSIDSLRSRLEREVKQRGYGKKQTIFLADGQKELWGLQQELFPKAIPCLDWYHLSEYLWDAGGTCHKEGSKELTAWVKQRQTELRNGNTDATIEALDELWQQIGARGPGATRRKRVEKAITYITNHLEQLNYKQLLAQDIDIATGAVEGAVKYLIGVRLDAQGMRWSERAKHVLALRLVMLNGVWSEFEQYVIREHEGLQDLVIPRITPKGPQKLPRNKAA